MLQGMPIEGNYEPSPQRWVRDQVEEYERSGGQRANTLRDTWPAGCYRNDAREPVWQRSEIRVDARRA